MSNSLQACDIISAFHLLAGEVSVRPDLGLPAVVQRAVHRCGEGGSPVLSWRLCADQGIVQSVAFGRASTESGGVCRCSTPLEAWPASRYHTGTPTGRCFEHSLRRSLHVGPLSHVGMRSCPPAAEATSSPSSGEPAAFTGIDRQGGLVRSTLVCPAGLGVVGHFANYGLVSCLALNFDLPRPNDWR